MAKKGTTKKNVAKATKAKVEKAVKKMKVDLDAIAAEAETSINSTDYQAYLRNKLKGIK